MPDSASVARVLSDAETAAVDAAALAERMWAVGAWGAYAALRDLARERAERVDRIRATAVQTGRHKTPPTG